jgi:uncharacterized protein with HEPN domain
VKDDRVYLLEILDRIQRIENFVQDGREAFMKSLLIQDAVIRNFEVIGEAVKNLSPEIRERNADIPWRQIAGFRDVLIHDYMSIVLREVWKSIEENLPGLKVRVQEILAQLNEQGE